MNAVHTRRLAAADRASAGQAMVEFALVLGIFILLFFGLIGLTVVFFGWLTTASAAREGTRYAVGDKAALDSAVKDHICETGIMLGGSKSSCLSQISSGELVVTIEPSVTSASVPRLPDSLVTVTVRFHVPVPTIRASFFNGGGITFLAPIWVESTSVMRVE